MSEPLNIIIDTQEQLPWAWAPHLVSTNYRKLDAGDYALAEDTTAVVGKATLLVSFAIERKSLADFVGTVATAWERFQRELFRMREFQARIIIVEGNFEECCFINLDGKLTPPQHNHNMITPQFLAKRIAELAMQNVTVLFAGDAGLAAGLAYRIFIERKRWINAN